MAFLDKNDLFVRWCHVMTGLQVHCCSTFKWLLVVLFGISQLQLQFYMEPSGIISILNKMLVPYGAIQ